VDTNGSYGTVAAGVRPASNEEPEPGKTRKLTERSRTERTQIRNSQMEKRKVEGGSYIEQPELGTILPVRKIERKMVNRSKTTYQVYPLRFQDRPVSYLGI
jgi:hypothetical protein